jgi:response regulator of citrate/malate metabolism
MLRVLVVDDDFMVARVHSACVARIPGTTVVGVEHRGADALAAAARLRPDLVLLDVHLPDLSGLEVLRRLRTGTPDDPFVLVITAADDAATVTAALHGGATHYLVKPFALQALRDQVERVARLRGELAGAAPVAQHAIDRLFGTGRGGGASLPKGLSTPTAELVERVLRTAEEDVSAAECAERAALSRVSARRYLEHFVDTGAASVRLRYGGTGRPERRYRWGRGG